MSKVIVFIPAPSLEYAEVLFDQYANGGVEVSAALLSAGWVSGNRADAEDYIRQIQEVDPSLIGQVYEFAQPIPDHMEGLEFLFEAAGLTVVE